MYCIWDGLLLDCVCSKDRGCKGALFGNGCWVPCSNEERLKTHQWIPIRQSCAATGSGREKDQCKSFCLSKAEARLTETVRLLFSFTDEHCCLLCGPTWKLISINLLCYLREYLCINCARMIRTRRSGWNGVIRLVQLKQMLHLMRSHKTNGFSTARMLQWANINCIFIDLPSYLGSTLPLMTQVISLFLTLCLFICFAWLLWETALPCRQHLFCNFPVHEFQVCLLDWLYRAPQSTVGAIFLAAVSSESDSTTFSVVYAPVNCGVTEDPLTLQHHEAKLLTRRHQGTTNVV